MRTSPSRTRASTATAAIRRQCPPQLTFQTFVDQQSNLAQFRINDGIQAEETLGVVPAERHGDHDIKFGVQYQYSGRRIQRRTT